MREDLARAGVDYRYPWHHVHTRQDGESRADLEIRTVHGSVRSIGTSKIVLTRENDQIHTVQSLWHTSSRGRTVDLERTSRYRNAYHVTTSTSHSVPHMWVVLRVRGIHCGSVNLLGRTEVL